MPMPKGLRRKLLWEWLEEGCRRNPILRVWAKERLGNDSELDTKEGQ